ncbi:hypothetical protein B0H14DRAFT_2626689 [Mycena olivaceomarginata]|nr:hypothetical protein B0H14DRAFT_2626689 [Mycena olivaceomarginata]
MSDSLSGSTPPALLPLLDSLHGIEECPLLASTPVSLPDNNSGALESTLISDDDSTSPEMPLLESIPSTPIFLQDSGSDYLPYSVGPYTFVHLPMGLPGLEDFRSDSESDPWVVFSPLLVSLPPSHLLMNSGALWSEEDDI